MTDYTVQIEQVALALAEVGWCVLDHALPPATTQALYEYCQDLDQTQFKAASIGRAHTQQHNTQIRTDQIAWQDAENPTLAPYFAWIEQLRLGLNRHLYLGLFDYECHYAFYPKGAFYRKHVDSFKAQRNRLVSTILYLNPDWHPDAGGELILYNEADTDIIATIQPELGRMVIFLSEVFPHEVATTEQSRYSLTGWYRLNPSHSLMIDPAH